MTGQYFLKQNFKIFKWASNYYLHPIGEVVISFLPTHLRQTKNTYEVSILDDNKKIIEKNLDFEKT